MWSYFPEKLRDQVYGLRQDDVRETLKRSCGVAAGEVTDIIATHLHFDHLGGAVTREGEGCVQTFPNALIHVQRAQLEWARGPSIKDRGSFVPEMVAALEGSGQLQVHEGDWELCQGVGVRVVSGHTPGMQLVTVRDGERTLIHAADLVPTSFHVPVPYIMAYDLNPLATAREKGEWYAANPEAIWFFQHDPEWPWWTVRRNEKGGYGRGERVGP
jgi:glyoxylase-like metal-dependent hydrolase (beta-lactamase superfamily II)